MRRNISYLAATPGTQIGRLIYIGPEEDGLAEVLFIDDFRPIIAWAFETLEDDQTHTHTYITTTPLTTCGEEGNLCTPLSMVVFKFPDGRLEWQAEIFNDEAALLRRAHAERNLIKREWEVFTGQKG